MNMLAYSSDQTPSGAALGLKGKLIVQNAEHDLQGLAPTCIFGIIHSMAARVLDLPGPLKCLCHAPSHLSALADASFLAGLFCLGSSSHNADSIFPGSVKITTPVKLY